MSWMFGELFEVFDICVVGGVVCGYLVIVD